MSTQQPAQGCSEQLCSLFPKLGATETPFRGRVINKLVHPDGAPLAAPQGKALRQERHGGASSACDRVREAGLTRRRRARRQPCDLGDRNRIIGARGWERGAQGSTAGVRAALRVTL